MRLLMCACFAHSPLQEQTHKTRLQVVVLVWTYNTTGEAELDQYLFCSEHITYANKHAQLSIAMLTIYASSLSPLSFSSAYTLHSTVYMHSAPQSRGVLFNMPIRLDLDIQHSKQTPSSILQKLIIPQNRNNFTSFTHPTCPPGHM